MKIIEIREGHVSLQEYLNGSENCILPLLNNIPCEGTNIFGLYKEDNISTTMVWIQFIFSAECRIPFWHTVSTTSAARNINLDYKWFDWHDWFKSN